MLPCVRYDYSSSHVGAGVGEQITVTANMRRFCTACTVYLAVYGYPGKHLTKQPYSTIIAYSSSSDSIQCTF